METLPNTEKAHEGLAGYQRRFLRALAHPLRPVVRLGRSGITPGVRAAIDAALRHHELIKVRMLQPEDKRGVARALAECAGAQLCGLVGHTAILYRRDPENPRIELPRRQSG